MLLCRTSLGQSKIAGIGLFAEEVIPKGTVIWVFREGLDLTITPAELEKMAEPAAQQVVHYSYQCIKSQNYILCGDDARFMNHANPANTHSESNGQYQGHTVAIENIQIGEEITTNYFEYDLDAKRKLPNL